MTQKHYFNESIFLKFEQILFLETHNQYYLNSQNELHHICSHM